MSNGNTTVSLTLQVKGQAASQELKRISDDQVRSTTKINQQWTQIQTAQAKFTQTAKVGSQAVVSTARAGDQLLRTNKMLEGVLRQQSIQTKLQSQQLKTQAASAKNMADWMKRVEQSSRITTQESKSTISNWQKAVAIGGGVLAAGAVVSNAMQKPRDYDQQLTYITATATGGQGLSTAERLKSKETLNNYIKTAVRNGGGSREDAAEAANALIASGKYDLNTVAPALNAAVKTAFSTDAAAKDAATLTVRMQDFGMTDIQKGHDIAVRGAQLGSFEYKDQAKWLAQQMAAAKAAGYSGEKGFVELVAMNQVAMSTASTTDEGGNNLVNLLAKLSSRDFSKAVADAVENTDGLPTKAVKNKKGKVVGQEFDWTTYSIAEREKGVYGVDAFVKLLERQLAGNSEYQNLQKRLSASTNDEEKKSLLEDMSNIASGSQLGEFLADRQALMAALAVYYKKDDLAKIKNDLPNAGGTVASEYDMVSQNDWAKDQAMNQEKLFAQSKAYDAISDSLGDFKDKVTDVARENEGLAASAYAAATALAAVAAAGAVSTVLSGGKDGGVVSKVGGAVTKAAAPVAKTAGAAAVAYAGYELYKPIDDYLYSKIDKFFGGSGDRPDYLQQAIDKSLEQQTQKNNEMIAKQEQNNQYSRELISSIKTLIGVTQNNKPIINFPGGSLQQSILGGGKEEKRHGAVPPYLLARP
ncbi:phage tail tape measure protein [Acinetobacter johnsonii]|uniref:phage tail tape measure protein n=1 Tax=Acinetobacter johnsonii TaxID=40214 RepID=UPI00103F7713|nr:phage tail tape measure protein [Acinetobacter johnsonii]QBK69389.1 hypothetical protein E0Z08_07560 [Acinetobacter johnsonii]